MKMNMGCVNLEKQFFPLTIELLVLPAYSAAVTPASHSRLNLSIWTCVCIFRSFYLFRIAVGLIYVLTKFNECQLDITNVNH